MLYQQLLVPVAEAFVVTRLPSPATLNGTSPSLRYLLPVEWYHPVKTNPLVVSIYGRLHLKPPRLPLFVPTKSVLIPLASMTLNWTFTGANSASLGI